MKRVLLLCLACMVLVSAVASAEVKKGKDNFTGGFNVSSHVAAEPFLKVVHLVKNVSDGGIMYKLTLSRIGSNKNVLGDEPIEMKVDGQPVYELEDYRYKLSEANSYGVLYNSVMDIKLPLNLIDRIKETKRLAIRFRDARGISYPYVLPDDVLAEWKEVINTEA